MFKIKRDFSTSVAVAPLVRITVVGISRLVLIAVIRVPIVAVVITTLILMVPITAIASTAAATALVIIPTTAACTSLHPIINNRWRHHGSTAMLLKLRIIIAKTIRKLFLTHFQELFLVRI